jgi:hypothetical protein
MVDTKDTELIDTSNGAMPDDPTQDVEQLAFSLFDEDEFDEEVENGSN